MAKIIDLSTMIKEDLTFTGGRDGLTYVIPGEISTKFVLTVQKLQEDMKGLSEEESVEKVFEIVSLMLSLDKSKDINIEYVKENFDNIKILNAIINGVMEYITELSSDPN